VVVVAKSRYPSVWAREAAERAAEERRAAEPPSSPTRAQIVRAAVEILDAEGLDALSMRRLGAKLGMGATSLYWYVANKTELLDLAIDEIYREVEVPEEGHWQLAASVFAYSMRQTLLRHPWAARLIGTRANIGPNSMAVAEKCLALFQNAGFHGVEADHAVTTLMAYVLGITTTETAWRETVAAAKMSVEEWLAQHKPAIEYAVRDLPRLRSLMKEVQGDVDPREAQAVRFDFGLKAMLDGLAARLPAS